MIVLYITHTTNMTDGSTKSFINLLDGVSERGVIPIVVCPNNRGLYQYLEDRGIEVYATKYHMSIYPELLSFRDYRKFLKRLYKAIVNNRKSEKHLLKVFENRQIDIIHTNTSVIKIGYNIAAKLNVKHVWHFREYQDLDFNIRSFTPKKKYAELIDAENNYAVVITKDIQESFNLSQQSSCVIYNGIKNRSEICFNAKKSNYFLFTGRLTESKGALHVVMAYLDLCSRFSEVPELWMIGRVSNKKYFKHIQNIVQSSQYADKIKMLGESNNVDEYMQNALAMIVASRFEGFGRITSEAMYNGCLVIGRNTGGTKEQMDNGLRLCGDEIALRFNTEEELTNQMSSIITNGIEYYYPYIQRSQNTVEQLYSNEAHIDQVYKLYNRL